MPTRERNFSWLPIRIERSCTGCCEKRPGACPGPVLDTFFALNENKFFKLDFSHSRKRGFSSSKKNDAGFDLLSAIVWSKLKQTVLSKSVFGGKREAKDAKTRLVEKDKTNYYPSRAKNKSKISSKAECIKKEASCAKKGSSEIESDTGRSIKTKND